MELKPARLGLRLKLRSQLHQTAVESYEQMATNIVSSRLSVRGTEYEVAQETCRVVISEELQTIRSKTDGFRVTLCRKSHMLPEA